MYKNEKVEALIVKEDVFFELLSENRAVASDLCKKMGNVINSHRKLNSYQASGPTILDLENDVDENTIKARIRREEKDFLYAMIRLSKEHGRFLRYVGEGQAEALMNEVLTFIYAIQVSNRVFAAV